jgi:hypothetical protein
MSADSVTVANHPDRHTSLAQKEQLMTTPWFSRRKQQIARPARRTTRARLQVEALEERQVLSTYYVVPGVANTVTTFSTIADCFNLTSFQNGDVVQIEPGSSPGHLVDGNIPDVHNLTIQGDPNADLSSVPTFYLDDHVSIDSSRQGFTLQHVQFDITNGTLQLLANATITDCHVKEDFAGEAIEVDGPTAAVISDSSFESDNPQSQQNDLLRVESKVNSHNRITDNQFVALTGTDITLLTCSGSGPGADLIAHNTFHDRTGGTLLAVEPGSQGLTVQGNTFTDDDAMDAAISVVPDVQDLKIVDNRISLPNGGQNRIGILVAGSDSATPSSMVIADNHISTAGLGVGLELSGQKPGVSLVARVQDNDLHNNYYGVVINAWKGGSVAGIDLGGGAQGSLGGNDFRGDTYAIFVTAPAAAGPVQAQMNIFGVADPTTVIYDHANAPALATVTATNPLTGNAAYVETLYLDFLHRAGDLNPADHDAAGWVILLGQGMPAAAVAGAIARSAEGTGVAVTDLFHRFLGRAASPGEVTAYGGYLQNGGTLEGVMQGLLASPEYATHYHTDADFVQSLYQGLLHRTGANADVSAWVAALPQLGRAVVAQQFLTSPEFRGLEVGDDYAQLLHRTPSTAEVNTWVGSTLDLLTIDTLFAGSPEFQQNG